jgi:hypothetical protein
VAELTNREIVERFIHAVAASQMDLQDQFVAEDVIEDYPQSGERMRGRANRRATIEHYPGRAEREFGPNKVDVVAGDDQWVITPTMSLVRINGGGERFTATGLITYPNRDVWHFVQLIELHGGKIVKLTTYFAAPFEPAPWRAEWVERMPAPD